MTPEEIEREKAELRRQIEMAEIKQSIAAVENREFSPVQTLKNFPKSATQLVTDTLAGGKALVQDTARVAASAALGEDELYTPTLSKALSGAAQHNTFDDKGYSLAERSGSDSGQMALAVGEFYGQRYGTPKRALMTLQDDPAGALADASAVASLPMLASSATSKALRLNGLSQGLKTASRVAAGIDPLTWPTHLAKITPKQSLYNAGFPNMRARNFDDAQRTAQFGLQNEIPATRGDRIVPRTESGLTKTRRMMNDRAGTRREMLSEAPDVDSVEIQQPVMDLKRDRGRVTGSATPEADVKAINNAAREYRKAIINQYPDGQIPAGDVNAMKVALYKQADEAYRNQLPSATQATYQALGKGAKEALEKRAPGIQGVNQDMGYLGNIMEALDPNSLDKAQIPNIDFTVRRLASNATNSQGTADLIGVLGGLARRRSTDLAILLKQMGENPAMNQVARQLLIQAGRTEAEAEEELNRLIQESLNDAS